MTVSQIVTINPGDKGVDYVSLTPAMKAWLLATDIRFAIRYIARSSKIGKIVTAAEIAWLHANGIAVCLNYEGGENDLYQGAPGGVANGAWSRQAATGYGCPDGATLFVSVDTDVTASNLGTATAYTRGFLGQIGGYRAGIYGDSDILNACRDLKPVGWLPNAWAWSPADAVVHINQGRPIAAINADPNVCLLAFPAWLPHDVPPVHHEEPKPTPTPATGKENDLMNQLLTIDLGGGVTADAQFYGTADRLGNILQCEWTGDGNPATRTGHKRLAHIAAGIEPRTIGLGSLLNMTRLGDRPTGDRFRDWSDADFASVIGGHQ